MARLRSVVALIGVHLVVSLAAIAVLAVKRSDHDVATQDAWWHGIIVAGTAVLLLTFAVRARRGSVAAYRRLRIASAVLLVALVVIVALPGAFPGWMRALEAVSAVCLIGVVLLVNSSRVRQELSPR